MKMGWGEKRREEGGLGGSKKEEESRFFGGWVLVFAELASLAASIPPSHLSPFFFRQNPFFSRISSLPPSSEFLKSVERLRSHLGRGEGANSGLFALFRYPERGAKSGSCALFTPLSF